MIIDIAPSYLYLGDGLDEERLKRAFLAGVTFESGDQPDDDWWNDAKQRWRDSQRVAARLTSIPNRVARMPTNFARVVSITVRPARIGN